MATQEPNVYAGLSVVIGGLMHARPKFFAKVMGELLFWVGEDKMTFGSDYGIWEPKWQIEGFVDWDYPSDEFSDFPRVTTATKKKILGLNAARLYDIKVPAEYQLPVGAVRPRGRGRRPAGHGVMTVTTDTTVGERRALRRSPRCATRNSTSRSPPWGSSRRAWCPARAGRWSGSACPPTSARRTSRSSWWPTPTTRSPPSPACGRPR